jgi:hypothetical protein
MRLHFRASILSLSIGTALTLVPAYATTITTYSTLSSWAAATAAGYQTVTFTGLTPAGTATNYYSATGVTSDGVEFIGYNSYGSSDIQVVDSSANMYYNDGTGDALIESASPATNGAALPYISIVLPSNITALGLDLWTASSAGMSFSITVGGNQYTVPTLTGNTEVFWGITSSSPISSLKLTVPASTYNSGTDALADNFSFGASDMAAAPEAGTYLLIGSGLIGFVMLRKRLVPKK